MADDFLRHGSYPHYYEFRATDSRPEQLKQCLLRCRERLGYHGNDTEIHMLDIGCNSGQLSQSVLEVVRQVLDPASVRLLGVDIDGSLVKEAEQQFQQVAGLEFAQANISAIASGKAPQEDPISRYLTRHSVDRFDFVFCFSTLMYVHLNTGDQGLRTVLDHICARTGKVLVLELQSWRKYVDHKRRLKREGGEGVDLEYGHYSTLEWRGNSGKLEQFVYDYVLGRGFEYLVREDGRNEFNRQMVIFIRSS